MKEGGRLNSIKLESKAYSWGIFFWLRIIIFLRVLSPFPLPEFKISNNWVESVYFQGIFLAFYQVCLKGISDSLQLAKEIKYELGDKGEKGW